MSLQFPRMFPSPHQLTKTPPQLTRTPQEIPPYVSLLRHLHSSLAHPRKYLYFPLSDTLLSPCQCQSLEQPPMVLRS